MKVKEPNWTIIYGDLATGTVLLTFLAHKSFPAKNGQEVSLSGKA